MRPLYSETKKLLCRSHKVIRPEHHSDTFIIIISHEHSDYVTHNRVCVTHFGFVILHSSVLAEDTHDSKNPKRFFLPPIMSSQVVKYDALCRQYRSAD